MSLTVRAVNSKADRKAFIDLPYRLYANDRSWVAPLRDEARGLIDPHENPWFEHGEAELFLAERAGRAVGRITAHIDRLATAQPAAQGFGPGSGCFGLFEAEDAEAAGALIARAEAALGAKGVSRALGPISLAMWDEPGLLTQGFDQPPTVMMGHNSPAYAAWIEAAGYRSATTLMTYALPIDSGFPDLVNRIVASGERNSKVVIRRVDKGRFDAEAGLILNILNDAWSGNWGFTPFTDKEIAYAGKKLKAIVYEDLIRVAEYDGEPIAFMMTLPDLNEKIATFGGTLWPLNWAKLLLWLRAPKVRTMRVPLMGVRRKHQGTRLASQLAMMMIEYIRRDSVAKFGATRGEFGWVLDDNGPMRSVAEAVGGQVNKVYTIYEKAI